MTRRPDFLVIGAAKAGTTSLCDALARHEGVFLYPRKEANFFNRHYERGLPWYESLFAEAPPGRLLGEGTPAYTFASLADTVAARIATDLPDVRLIYMVRDPVERVRSQYVQEIANGREEVSLSQAILTWGDLASNSRYEAILGAYLNHFDATRIHVIFFEDLVQDFAGTYAECLAFLGLPPAAQVTLAHLGGRDDRQRGGALLRRLRKTALYNRFHHSVPQGLSRRLKDLLSQKVDTKALDLTISPEAAAHLDALLAKDTAAFLTRMGRAGFAAKGQGVPGSA